MNAFRGLILWLFDDPGIQRFLDENREVRYSRVWLMTPRWAIVRAMTRRRK